MTARIFMDAARAALARARGWRQLGEYSRARQSLADAAAFREEAASRRHQNCP